MTAHEAIVDRLIALANAEDAATVGASRCEKACHRAARDAYLIALETVRATVKA